MLFNKFRSRFVDKEDLAVRKEIEEYVNKVSRGLNKKDSEYFEKIVVENEEIAKDIYRTTISVNKVYIMMYLNKNNKGHDIACENVKRWASGIDFATETKEVKELINWLNGNSDIQPTDYPRNTGPIWYGRKTNNELCYLSIVSSFPKRLAVYGFYQGYVDIVREPIKSMMSEINYEYASNYLEELLNEYSIPKRNVVLMLSAMYAAPHKTKGEELLYSSYVKGFLLEDKQAYLDILDTVDNVQKKKIYNKLKNAELI